MGDRPTDTIATLQHVLASAARIAQDLADDPLLPRVLDVFSRMPAEDRETIVNVIDREVDLRNMTKVSSVSGMSVTKPNPHARLYFRVTETEPSAHVSPQEIVQAVIRAARVVHRAAQRGTDLYQVWGPAITEGLQRVTPEERATLRWYHRTMLDLLEESERESN
jgi:ribosome-binding factor A